VRFESGDEQLTPAARDEFPNGRRSDEDLLPDNGGQMTAPTTATTASSPVIILLTWLPRVALAVIFAAAGFSKVAGDPAMIDLFSDIGAGQGLRYVVGVLEIAGAIGVLVPRLCGLAAAGLALLMLGATITNIAVLGYSPIVTLFLLAIAAFTVWLRRHHLDPRQPRRQASKHVVAVR
jgi:putative oxidoreductase